MRGKGYLFFYGDFVEGAIVNTGFNIVFHGLPLRPRNRIQPALRDGGARQELEQS